MPPPQDPVAGCYGTIQEGGWQFGCGVCCGLTSELVVQAGECDSPTFRRVITLLGGLNFTMDLSILVMSRPSAFWVAAGGKRTHKMAFLQVFRSADVQCNQPTLYCDGDETSWVVTKSCRPIWQASPCLRLHKHNAKPTTVCIPIAAVPAAPVRRV
ncbi:unnamed protein product [Protopolystoma xenopodis]|uniref:Uncharacterized protein n=1 Tax=Protopolystoma xenopodis TaxID=117903 RepID=A0A448WLT4_9PLAT|nr:unnamed protein product [Protopolystoma xenopodis]